MRSLCLLSLILMLGCDRDPRWAQRVPEPPEGFFRDGDVQCFDGGVWTRGFRTPDGMVCIAGVDNIERLEMSQP